MSTIKFPYQRALLPELKSLRSYFQLYRELEPGSSATKLLAEDPARKRHLYVGLVVGLYGALEEFIESSVEQYVDAIVSLRRWSGGSISLPDRMVDAHYNLARECLMGTNSTRPGSNRTRAEILDELLSVQRGEPSKMSGEFFRYHSSNIRADTISKMLSYLGIGQIFASCLPDGDRSRRALDQLVDARNECSHGKLSHLASTSELESWLDLTEFIGASLETTLLGELGALLVATNQYSELKTTEGPYMGGKCSVGVFENDITVAPGMIVLAQRQSAPRVQWGVVTSIQLDDESVFEQTPLTAGKSVGIASSLVAKKNYKVYICSRSEWPAGVLPMENRIG